MKEEPTALSVLLHLLQRTIVFDLKVLETSDPHIPKRIQEIQSLFERREIEDVLDACRECAHSDSPQIQTILMYFEAEALLNKFLYRPPVETDLLERVIFLLETILVTLKQENFRLVLSSPTLPTFTPETFFPAASLYTRQYLSAKCLELMGVIHIYFLGNFDKGLEAVDAVVKLQEKIEDFEEEAFICWITAFFLFEEEKKNDDSKTNIRSSITSDQTNKLRVSSEKMDFKAIACLLMEKALSLFLKIGDREGVKAALYILVSHTTLTSNFLKQPTEERRPTEKPSLPQKIISSLTAPSLTNPTDSIVSLPDPSLPSSRRSLPSQSSTLPPSQMSGTLQGQGRATNIKQLTQNKRLSYWELGYVYEQQGEREWLQFGNFKQAWNHLTSAAEFFRKESRDKDCGCVFWLLAQLVHQTNNWELAGALAVCARQLNTDLEGVCNQLIEQLQSTGIRVPMSLPCDLGENFPAPAFNSSALADIEEGNLRETATLLSPGGDHGPRETVVRVSDARKISLYGMLFVLFSVLIVLKVDQTLNWDWWIIFVPLGFFEGFLWYYIFKQIENSLGNFLFFLFANLLQILSALFFILRLNSYVDWKWIETVVPLIFFITFLGAFVVLISLGKLVKVTDALETLEAGEGIGQSLVLMREEKLMVIRSSLNKGRMYLVLELIVWGCSLLFVVLVALRTDGTLSLSWWWIFVPVWVIDLALFFFGYLPTIRHLMLLKRLDPTNGDWRVQNRAMIVSVWILLILFAPFFAHQVLMVLYLQDKLSALSYAFIPGWFLEAAGVLSGWFFYFFW